MTKNNGWNGAVWALVVVFGIAGIIWFSIKTIEAITFFYQMYTVWFWLIVSSIIITPIIVFFRFQIADTFHNIRNRKKPHISNGKGDKHN